MFFSKILFHKYQLFIKQNEFRRALKIKAQYNPFFVLFCVEELKARRYNG